MQHFEAWAQVALRSLSGCKFKSDLNQFPCSNNAIHTWSRPAKIWLGFWQQTKHLKVWGLAAELNWEKCNFSFWICITQIESVRMAINQKFVVSSRDIKVGLQLFEVVHLTKKVLVVCINKQNTCYQDTRIDWWSLCSCKSQSNSYA